METPQSGNQTHPAKENSKTIHILLIHQAFAALDEPGGTRHHEMARYLAGHGHRVTVIASPVSYLTGSHSGGATGGTQPAEKGITILRPYAYPAWHRSFLHRVFSFLTFMLSSFFSGLRVREVDVVWGTSPPIFQGGTAWALARLKRVPFVFEVRDLWPAFAISVGVLRQPFLIRLAEWFERFLYRHADRLIVNSPGFIDHVRARGAINVSLVPNGADASMFPPEVGGGEYRRKHGLEGKFVAMYAGAHGLSNDLGVVLDAAALLRDRPEITIVLVGDGKEKPGLVRQAEERSLNNVFFLPPVPKLEMAEVLAAADVCIAILKPVEDYKTVYPNKVFDYMAAGRAVILAIDGVIRRVVEDGEAGIFSAPGDGPGLAQNIRALADDPLRCLQLGANGRAHILTFFDRPAISSQLESILVQVSREI